MKSSLYYIDFTGSELQLGGSALAQSLGQVGDKAPRVASADVVKLHLAPYNSS